MQTDALAELVKQGRVYLSGWSCPYSLIVNEWWLVRDPSTGELSLANVVGDMFGDKGESRHALSEGSGEVKAKLVELLGNDDPRLAGMGSEPTGGG
jgi:hypothetical protein